MKLGLIDAAWWGLDLDPHQMFERTKSIGFDFIDLIVDPLDLSDADRRALCDASTRSGLPVVSVPCVAFGLTDPFPAVRRFHIDRAKRHADLAAELDAELLLAVGEHVWNREVLPEDEVWQLAVEGTRAIAEHAGDCGVSMVIENEPFSNSIVNTAERMVAFVTDVAISGVKLCVDLSHLWLLRTEPSTLKIFDGLVGHVHLSDCSGKVHEDLVPGDGTAPLVEYMTVIRRIGYAGPVAIELQWPETPGLEARIAWIERAFQAGSLILDTVDGSE